MLVWIIAAQLTDAGDRKELEENQLVTWENRAKTFTFNGGIIAVLPPAFSDTAKSASVHTGNWTR
jgi:hypothetical protein